MCGIIGRIGKTREIKRSLDAIKELEYRGYDSYGIVFWNHQSKISVLEKDAGELVEEKIEEIKNSLSNIELGHTRWATHGGVNQINSHPHYDKDKEFFVVMNGIIENHYPLRLSLENLGYKFLSDTDTEIIVHLYHHYNKELNNDINFNLDEKEKLIEITKKVLEDLSGEFSFVIKYKNYLICYKNINPLIIGVCETEIFVSSDLNIIQNNSPKYHLLDDNELVMIEYCDGEKLNYDFYNKNFGIIKKVEHLSVKNLEIKKKKETKYYMEKEIFEQINIGDLLTIENIANFDYLLDIARTKKVVLTGAGTSYHAALYMHYILLELGIISNVIVASELKNYSSLLNDSLIVVFSQSGETADLIYPLKELDKSNFIFTITNTKNSTLDRMSKRSIYLNCQKEVAVASTKTFSRQMFLSIILKSISNNKSKLSSVLKEYNNLFDEVISKNIQTINEITKKFRNSQSFFFIGRNKFYSLALEGALKFKEITYIHAEGFAGGELKHGSLALIEKNIPVVVIGDDVETLSNATEIKTRGGIIIGISQNNSDVFDYHIEIPEILGDIFITIMTQILSFKMCVELGFNPDKPRNLAKSVTVK